MAKFVEQPYTSCVELPSPFYVIDDSFNIDPMAKSTIEWYRGMNKWNRGTVNAYRNNSVE